MQDTRQNLAPKPNPLQRVLVSVCGGLLVLGGLWFAWTTSVDRGQQRLRLEAEEEFRQQNFESALQLSERYLDRTPDSTEMLLVAGRSAMALGRPQSAIRYFERLVEDAKQETDSVVFALGSLMMEQGDAERAEHWFRRALELKADFVLAKQQLAYLLDVQGRRDESIPWRLSLLQQGVFDRQDLIVLGHPEAVLRSEDLERFRQQTPDNLLLRLPDALELDGTNPETAAQAEATLRELLKAAPDQLRAQVALGKCLLNRSASGDELLDWHKQLPSAADQSCGIWIVRGLWALQLGQRDAATRCFWQGLRLDPNDQIGCYQLSQSLAAEDKQKLARQLAERADTLQQFIAALDTLDKAPNDVTRLRELAQLAERLGRLWEAGGWYRLAADAAPQLPWPRAGLERITRLLTPGAPQVVASMNPIHGLDLSGYPEPDFIVAASTGPSTESATVVFRNTAAESGIKFQYFNSEDSSTPGRRMFEFTGGGVAVLDYDGDSWPDLYLTQGCRWPPQRDQTEHRDRLYRNLGDGTFVDVTDLCGLGDNGFSQGVAAGDINNDGFPDLLVANIGTNRLYENQGDGTFTEITKASGLVGERWTTSCMIADVNGDGWADIYEVNYVEGKDVFDLICRHGDSYGICQPTDFRGQADRLFINLGDGTFAQPSDALQSDSLGGLGVVAADFDGTGRPAIFVANDMTPNFYLVNSQPPGNPPQFRDQAQISGLAYDRDGNPQACMGIAAGDANGDGRIDLFVTNFLGEPNTLYRAEDAGFFVDDSRRAGLAAPSLPLLGFGTQFLDGELDGLPDLVVTNGHIHDMSHRGELHEMRPQYFRNTGGTFVEILGDQIGDYFQQQMLGRGLALVDYDQDGREDFAVSHLDLPLALMRNVTDDVGNFLAIRLRGTQSARDAHGTQVTVSRGTQRFSQQLTAGSGYHASNQKQLVFGLGKSSQAVGVHVRWSSGREQSFTELDVNQHIILVEGRDTVYSVQETVYSLQEEGG